MASLKDMRVRLASTKATQKITKAMQMVAASKLRRAQVAAEAARPYAERMDDGARQHRLGGRRQQFGAAPARRHRRRQGASAGRLHRRARPVRRLQLLDRPPGARARPMRCWRTARRSRFSASAARAPTSSAASSASRSSRSIELRGVTHARLRAGADRSPTRSSRASTPASSTSPRCSSRASSR